MPIVESRLRAWRWSRQGLDGSLKGKSAAAVLERSGWARSVGGAGPYLTLHARAGISREAADAAAAALEIHELPAARGCTYVLPAADFALGLKAGAGFDTEIKTALKLGVTAKEIDRLCGAVAKALGKGPLDPDGLKKAVGGAVRNLGAEGAKKGLTTTLPLALGRLQGEGEIRRIPANGRLDGQRYRYTLWRPNPLAAFKLSAEEVHAELARRYFRWTGPATVAEFQWFSGLGVKAAKSAVGALKLTAIDRGRFVFPEDLDALASYAIPQAPDYALVSGIDALFLLRRNLEDTVEAQGWSGKFVGRGLKDLPDHAIVDRGRLAGLWEFDTESASIAWHAFEDKDKAMEAAVKRTEAFVRDQLGDARSFSLDSPKSRRPRIEALRRGEEIL